MKAIAQTVYGSADVLELRELAQPTIGPGEVLVEVRAAGVGPGVWIAMTGRPWGVRVAFGLTRPKVPVRGRALAGVVAAVGASVTGFEPGDEVYGTSSTGTFAEYVAAQPRRLARKPARLSFAQAAAVPISGVTALEAVRDGARVQPGQKVMVIGAAGGIGSFMVQIAKAYGATVTGVCGTDKVELVRSLGVDDVIDYSRAEVDRDGGVYDVILDTAGCRPLPLLRRALTPRGTLVIVGGGHDAPGPVGGYTRQMRVPFVSLFTSQRLVGLTSKERGATLDDLARLIDDGKVTPVIHRTYPLAEAAEAIRYVAGGHAAGKVVVTV